MDDELLKIEEVAEMTGVPVNTLYFWRSSNPPRGPVGVRLEGTRRLTYRRSDVEAWLDAQFAKAVGE